MNTQEKEETIWVLCASCGHKHRKHRVLYEKSRAERQSPYEPIDAIHYYRFVECMGCESLKYVTSFQDPFDQDPDEDSEYNVRVYPDAPGFVKHRAAAFDNVLGVNELVPATVLKMYMETLDALNGDIRTLAAGGLRATVEAICLDSGITDGSLQKKIDELAKRNLLTSAQAALLHEERYLGNKALHELETPSLQALDDGLSIVEGLMTTIYVLPQKAERLRKQREAD